MANLQFIHPGGTFTTDSYFSTDDDDLQLYQPVELSTGADKLVYSSRRTDRKRSVSLRMLTYQEKTSLNLFFASTVDAMVEQFTLRDFSYYSPFTFDSTTAFTFDSTVEPTFDNDHVSHDVDYRFNQPSLEFAESNTLHSTAFELLEAD